MKWEAIDNSVGVKQTLRNIVPFKTTGNMEWNTIYWLVRTLKIHFYRCTLKGTPMDEMEWETRVLEKGRVTIPSELRTRLNLRKGDKVRFSLEGGTVHMTVPKLGEDVVEKTKGSLRTVEPELTPEELEEAFLTAVASKVQPRGAS